MPQMHRRPPAPERGGLPEGWALLAGEPQQTTRSCSQREALARARVAVGEAVDLDRSGWSASCIAQHYARRARLSGRAA